MRSPARRMVRDGAAATAGTCAAVAGPRCARPWLRPTPDQVLGLRLRYGRARLARHRWQVGGQLRQLPVGAGGQRRLNPLVKLGPGQPPVAGRDPEDLNDPVPVFVRGAQLGHGLVTGAIPRRRDLTSHGHILLAVARCRKLAMARCRKLGAAPP